MEYECGFADGDHQFGQLVCRGERGEGVGKLLEVSVGQPGVCVCMFVCLFACLFVCLFVCVSLLSQLGNGGGLLTGGLSHSRTQCL